MDYVRSDQCHRVSFADVWYLFRPRDEVVDQGGKQAYRIIGVTSSPHKVMSPYRNWETSTKDEQTVMLHCVHIDFDGKYLGPVLQTFRIARFDGEKTITSLRIFPLRLAGTWAGDLMTTVDVRQKLIARCKMFIDVLAKKHMHYSGLTLETRDEVDGQVVIDFEKAFESEDKAKQPAELENNVGEDGAEEEVERMWRPKIGSLISVEHPELSESDCTAACCARERVHKDMYAEQKRNKHYRNTLIPEELSQQPSAAIHHRVKDSRSSDDALSDDDYVIMSYRVFGFCLRSRKWEKLDLTHLSYIRGIRVEGQGENTGKSQVRETAFDQLVLEEGHKKILLSLVAQHYRDKESPSAANEQVDIVRGKGKGLIILLRGAPGVGKTTTAEGVAELFEKPLFQITCAQSVEHALETNFALAHRWGCILLLDEADVFLAKRIPQDFKRNGLVSVFLRVLEYYAGILFLTTNRIGDFDEAFGSRIHISLQYPQLTLSATKEIFLLNMRLIRQRFTEKKRNITVDQDSILAYVEKYWKTHKKMRWNGRQIRNACQTALALAEFEAGGGSHEKIIDPTAEVTLSITHLETVSKAYLEFMQYLKKLYKVDQDRLAQRRGVRARESDGKEMNFTDDDEDQSDIDGDGDAFALGKDSFKPETTTPGLLSPSGLSQNLTTSTSPTPVSPFEAATTATPEYRPATQTSAASHLSGYPSQMPGYPQALSQGWPPAVLAQTQAGFGFGHQQGGMPPSQQQPQQVAQMWQNMNPAMWQQAMLPSQLPPFAGMGTGNPNQQPHPEGSGTEKS